MKSEIFYDAISSIRPEYIVEAEHLQAKLKTKRVRRILSWTSLAAALAIAAGIGLAVLSIKNNDASGDVDGNSADGCSPVLPMIMLEKSDMLHVSRDTSFDLSDFKNTFFGGNAIINDRYVIDNRTGREQNCTLLYPIQTSLSEEKSGQETQILVNNKQVHSFRVAGDALRDLPHYDDEQPDSWFETVLSDGDYLRAAIAPQPELTQRAIIYKISDPRYMEQLGEGMAFLSFRAEIDPERSTAFSWGDNGGGWDGQTKETNMQLPNNEAMYLVLIGDELKEYTVFGKRYNENGEEMTFDASCRVERSETTLGAFLKERLAEKNTICSVQEDIDLLCNLLARQLNAHWPSNDDTVWWYSGGQLHHICLNLMLAKRVLYELVDVVVPANGSIEVTAVSTKAGSVTSPQKPYSGYIPAFGFAFTTQTGNLLAIDNQTVKITGVDSIKISNDNIGFDLEHGTTEVTLEPSKLYYFWVQIKD